MLEKFVAERDGKYREAAQTFFSEEFYSLHSSPRMIKAVAVPWLIRSVTDLSRRGKRFAPGSVRVWSVVDKMTLGQAFLQFFGPLLSI
jgi:hypothetical protein